MEQLSADQVAELLKDEGFPENVVQLFKDNAVDGEALMMLETDDDMKEVGLNKLGDRLKIKKFISKYRGGADTKEVPPADHGKSPPEQEMSPFVGVSDYNVIDQPLEENVELTPSVSSPGQSRNSAFAVTFNVIVSGFCWEWDSTTSKLYIVLNPPELGGVRKCNLLKPQLLWCTENNLFVYKFLFEIPYNIVTKYTFIYYKYVAKTSRKNELQAEHIWNVSSTKPGIYRCMEIPHSEKTPGGMWERWDTIVYPKEVATLHGTKVAPEGYMDYFAQKWRNYKSEDSIKMSELITDDPENQELADERCLLTYLQSHQDRLVLCEVSSGAGISQIIHTIQKIFAQLQTKDVGFLNFSLTNRIYFTRKEHNSSQKIAVVMEQWVMNIVHSLRTKIDQCRVDGRHVDDGFLLSAIAVLCIADKTITLSQLSEQNCVQMSSLLRESYRPNRKQKACSALYALKQHLPTPQFRRDVVMSALKTLALLILQKSNDKNWRWLETVPLFHYLANLSVPFDTVPIDRAIPWIFWPELENSRKKQSYNSYSCMEEALVYVEDLMELDFVFAKVVLYMCPDNELYVVLQRVDPILASKFYIWYVQNHGITKAKDPEVLHQHLTALKAAHLKILEDEWMRKSAVYADCAHELLKVVLEAISGISENNCEIMFRITNHVLFIISHTCEVKCRVIARFEDKDERDRPSKVVGERDRPSKVVDERDRPSEVVDERDRPSKVVDEISHWLQQKTAVGEAMFGGAQCKKFEEEVHVWRVLYRESICPENIRKHWINVIEQLLEERAKMVKDKAELLLLSDKKELDTPLQVRETLIHLMTDELLSPELSQIELSQKVDKLATQSQSSGNVSKLFSLILTRHLKLEEPSSKKMKEKETFKRKKQKITFAELVSWEVWPKLMKITCDEQSELFRNLTDRAKKLCQTARTVLQNKCDLIVTGKVTMKEMNFISTKERQVQQLCAEAAMDFNLKKWLGHLEAVVAYNKRVQMFLSQLKPGVKDYETLQEELMGSINKPMNKLCSNWSDESTASTDLQFECCPTIQPCLQSILTPFDLVYKSELFNSIWKTKLSTALKSHCGAFTQENIVELVWRPTVKNCQLLIDKLKSGNMLLSEVKEIFGKQNFRQSCLSLMNSLPSDKSEAVNGSSASVNASSDKHWIDIVCKQVDHCNISFWCVECAQQLLSLRDKLELKGDFSHLQLVVGDHKWKNLRLCDVTDLFQEDISMLHGISDEYKVMFLKSLVNNWKFVEWIKDFKSVKDLQGFVDLALDTSDTTEETITLLTDLRTVGSAVGQLLFNLPDSCGLNELVAACSVLWDGSFDHRLLEMCSNFLGLFNNLKATQGSLERKTIDEIKIINEFGEVIIGREGTETCKVPSEVISLKVTAGDSDEHMHSEQIYTFQELQDLISLIVLITGKSKPENQSGMQTFLQLFRKMYQIAEVLIAMHQEGYMESIGDFKSYDCSSTTVVELNKKVQMMEEKLKKWTMLVENTRSRYYSLNSFTNKQLCLLRRELCNPTGLKREVKFLLNALLPCTSDSDINDIVQKSWQHLSTTLTVDKSNLSVEKHTRANGVPPENASASGNKQPLEVKHLAVLTAKECDSYRNMTESQGVEPSLALLAIIRSSSEGICELDDVIEKYEDIKLELKDGSGLTLTDVYEQINKHLLSKGSPALFLVDEQQISDCEGENVSSECSTEELMMSPLTDCFLTSVDYLTLEQLGRLLQEIVSGQERELIQKPRKFQGIDLEKGSPNLIVTRSDHVLTCTMMLYAEDNEMPLPTQEEVLICTSETTAEEVILLWRRAIGDPGFKRIFCLVHAEKLPYHVSEECVRSLLQLKQEKHANYRLVIICCKEDDSYCHIIENLHVFLRPTPDVQNETRLQHLKQYLTTKFCNPEHNQLGVPPLTLHQPGWKVDIQQSCVRVVQSSRVGMGKSLYITERAQELADKFRMSDSLATVRVHGPKIAEERIMDQLQSLGARSNEPLIIHFDIAPSMVRVVDCFLFSILFLGYFNDRRGKLWRRRYSHLYMIELTLQTSKELTSFATTNLLKLLPTWKCPAPVDDGNTDGEHHLNHKEWLSNPYQLVYHYLRDDDPGSDKPKFKDIVRPVIIERNKDFLQCIFCHYKAKKPSWRELEYFILFLSTQLSAFEQSGFCDTGYMCRTLPGMRSLVMKMIIQMSKEFTLPSLRDDDDVITNPVKYQNEVHTYRWRKWNESFHPYLLFNQDNISFTFVGFNVTSNGDAIDPATSDVIVPKIMSSRLRSALVVVDRDIDLLEDYRKWKREKQLQKLATVIGLDPQTVKDPDPSYVLTVDNFIKILAIIMRLRCRIPVILMGETGCGKTQLLRFLCSLIAQALPTEGFQNFISVKIHGGTTEDTIVQAVEKAERCVVQNEKLVQELKESVEKAREERVTREAIEAVEAYEAKQRGAKGSKLPKGQVKKTDTTETEKSTELFLDGTKLGTILFFDEANTTDHIDLIKEIMCDHTLYGRRIHEDVRVVAACNPYRQHSKEMIEKLESAGLGFCVKAREMLASSGIPLRHLVYRVHDLPPSMKSLVYDFGELDDDAEEKYISEIVKKHLQALSNHQRCCDVIAKILNLSQKFMRKNMDECSYASLRDVDRAMIVFKFFHSKSEVIKKEMDKLYAKSKDEFIQCDVTRAVLLALAVCYYARLQEPKKRSDFATAVSSVFTSPLCSMTSHMFVEHVQCCQKVFLNNMGAIGQNIAHNMALRENVMMMVVCINLRIPLFLIGKPGSSKSLAKTVVNDSLRKTAPTNDFLKNFKEVQMLSYQCSQLSTSDSILNVFRQAEAIQNKKQDKNKFVSVVVLDEVGLAEDSPSLPLKVLHPLLEDGTEGNSHSVDVVDREKRVAFIGISNWALDPAKMNRGIMVKRCDPDENELTESASEICSSGGDDDVVAKWLEPCFRHFAKAYLKIVQDQTATVTIRKEFFGLRDFYSMVKMLYWMCKEANCHPNRVQIDHVVLRNFSGYEGFDPLEVFNETPLRNFSPPPSKDEVVNNWQEQIHAQFREDKKALEPLLAKLMELNAEQLLTEYTQSNYMSKEEFLFQKFKEYLDSNKFPDEESKAFYEQEFKNYFQLTFENKIWPLIHPDCSPAGLIKASLANKERTYHGENRYLLFLTESYAALQTLQHFNYQRSVDLNSSQLESVSATVEQQPPLILFGSSFPNDRHFTQVYRHINTIKICMETGRTVVLLNLEEVYESLYDALNQYYREYGPGTRFIDLGLRTHRIKCRVHNDFKLILIAEKDVVYDRFPTPLINRLEKHVVDTSTVLNESVVTVSIESE